MFDPWVRKIPWRRKWQPTPVFLPGKSHGRRSLVGYSSWGCKESNMTYWLNNNHKIYIYVYSLFHKGHTLLKARGMNLFHAFQFLMHSMTCSRMTPISTAAATWHSSLYVSGSSRGHFLNKYISHSGLGALPTTPWRRQWHPTPVLLPGKSHGWRSLVGCSPWGH